ncbi:adenine phosphoribosyltransferase [Galbitalea sp. SE-J8]|uniref:adenine phosphoribosyltransferase n=1 Tax=Galbitalea sp. SE-J8 TaxID=3054952 RepID=UPI00259CA300|nr:adenine phosphoribosyltransferase [Galbitalea sp. SE-J8]MDM4763410.1 adenine phosphoribosyltransferase [Galbitalea sp. SE-J8]
MPEPSAALDTARRSIDELTALVPDFPKPGILFRDLTPVFADGAALRAVTDALVEPFADRVDAVAGVEARGFVLAASAAYALGTGMLIIRKPGKLPRPHLSRSYDLEYGSATLEGQPDDLPAGSRVLVLDDILATGGTLAAAAHLVEAAGWSVAGISVVLELDGLGGRGRLPGYDVRTLSAVGL